MQSRRVRFHGLVGTAAVLVAVILTLTGCGRGAGRQRRDIVLLTIDTLRADHIGAYGYATARTPTIDRLARQGVRFELAFTPLARTTPALASLHTGLLPLHHGSREVGLAVRHGTMIAEILGAHGYETLAVSANAAAGPVTKLDRGFARFIRAPELPEPIAEEVTSAAIELARQAPPERPLFLWAHYMDPHYRYLPPEDFPQPEARPCRELIRRRDAGALDRGLVQADVDGVASRSVAACTELYDAEIAYTDTQLARLLQELEVLGRLRNAVIVLTADHGENLGEWGLFYEHGPNLHDASLRVPLIVTGQGIEPRVDARVARLQDLAPTLLGLAGLADAVPAELDGVDLRARLGLAVGPAPSGERPLEAALVESATSLSPTFYRQIAAGRRIRCVHGRRFSLCGRRRGRFTLHDHLRDPWLETDVSDRYPEVRRFLAEAWDRWTPDRARRRGVRTRRFLLVERPRLEGGYDRSLYYIDGSEEIEVTERYPEVAERLGRLLDSWERPEGTSLSMTSEQERLLRSLGYID